jgi:DNA-binding beta-propeller fold protein YncE
MNQVIELLVEKIDKQSEQLERQSKQIEVLMNKESKTININNTVNQQQTNVFNIVPFGKEKFDYITFDEYNEIFEQGFRCMQMLISLIYCNDKNPQNMNVYVSNFNDNSIRIFDGKNWIIEKKDYVLTNMYNSKRDFLELKFEDMYDKLSKNAKYFFKRFKAGNTDQETIEPILDELKSILYANRNNVIKNPAKIKQQKLIGCISTESKTIISNQNEKKPRKKLQIKEDINDPNYIPNKSMFF